MINKFIGPIIFLIVLVQILFSFYYSSEIITQNNNLNKNLNQLSTLKIQNEELENKFAQITSLNNLNQIIKAKNFVPIKQEISLQ